MKKITLSICIATLLWFIMFSPWTASHVNFWYCMTSSGIILTSLALIWGRELIKDISVDLKNIALGISIAIVLWGLFWIGDKVSQWMFDFARPEVNTIYDMKGMTSPYFIAITLLFIIGPAEEIFWRGFIQRNLMKQWGANTGFILTTLAYTLIHIWSFNFMLVMAALIVGFLWGLLYRINQKWLFPLILSHALWDCAAFVIFPF
ncbi:CPBP family intramembrane glutamic endopeptidase [Phocaeicola oris]|uniref:CPBP family intramembrane glutamic endopeptidase n=1 Tax=Phocaeicola oris TaxID=2896850 RepID=UPI00234EA0E7|nr:CPBP family intramembrane glutamic endopeptidase [Phocaeicola oris]MCE2615926.1 CPBP family intramembrane metalloprotease [Phocaeicola oris]